MNRHICHAILKLTGTKAHARRRTTELTKADNGPTHFVLVLELSKPFVDAVRVDHQNVAQVLVLPVVI